MGYPRTVKKSKRVAATQPLVWGDYQLIGDPRDPLYFLRQFFGFGFLLIGPDFALQGGDSLTDIDVDSHATDVRVTGELDHHLVADRIVGGLFLLLSEQRREGQHKP